MSIIHITTELVAKNTYEFIQTFITGAINVEEKNYVETHEDRMYAAMTNLGYACRWFADLNYSRGDICIITDTDGKDTRYNGEHNDLFKAIRSRHDYQENRTKYALIYGKYVKFLDRIRELADAYEINFTQNDKVLDEILYEGKEFVKNDTSPFLIKNQNWTKDNILALSLKGSKNIITCRACQQSITYQQSDTFTKFWMRIPNMVNKSVKIRSNKHLVECFMNWHLEMHTDNKDK